eukprot:6829313-Prymnesium_polylepis.1
MRSGSGGRPAINRLPSDADYAVRHWTLGINTRGSKSNRSRGHTRCGKTLSSGGRGREVQHHHLLLATVAVSCGLATAFWAFPKDRRVANRMADTAWRSLSTPRVLRWVKLVSRWGA